MKEVVTDKPTTDTLFSETSKPDNENQSLPATQRLTETKPNYHKQRKPRRPFKRNTWSVWPREFPLSKELSGKSLKTTPCGPTDKKSIKWSAVTDKLPAVSYSLHNCGSTPSINPINHTETLVKQPTSGVVKETDIVPKSGSSQIPSILSIDLSEILNYPTSSGGSTKKRVKPRKFLHPALRRIEARLKRRRQNKA